MAGFKLTGLGAGSTNGNSLRYEQVFTTATGILSLLGGLFIPGPLNTAQAATITATATVALAAMTGNYAVITGTATVSSFDALGSGGLRIIEWSGATTIDNNANMAVQGNATVVASTGDMSLVVSEGAGNWRLNHFKRSGAPINMSPITNSLSGNVNLSNTGTYFDGPSVAQGTAGTWFVSGTIVVDDTLGSADVEIKLWDGSTVIASTHVLVPSSTNAATASLSGFIKSPAGNLRISAKDGTSTSGHIIFNKSGNSMDSTITAIRIA